MNSPVKAFLPLPQDEMLVNRHSCKTSVNNRTPTLI